VVRGLAGIRLGRLVLDFLLRHDGILRNKDRPWRESVGYLGEGSIVSKKVQKETGNFGFGIDEHIYLSLPVIYGSFLYV